MGIINTAPSGLLDSTQYYFYVNSVEYDITTAVGPTYQDVSDLMHLAVLSNGFHVKIAGANPNGDIRVINDGVRGHGSEVALSFGTTGLDLFTALTGFTAFDDPVDGLEVDHYSCYMPSGGMIISGAADTSYIINGIATKKFYGDDEYNDGYYEKEV